MATPSTLSPSTDTLTMALNPLRRRMTRARAHRLTSRGALVGAVLSLMLATLAHFRILPDTLPLALAIAALLLSGTGIGLAAALSRPITTLQAARLAEARSELKERLSSALLLTGGSAELLRLQQEDAVFHARQIDAVQTVPLRWPAEAKALVIVLAALALLLWLPTLPVFLSPTERTERAIVQKEGAKLIRQGRLAEKQGAAQGLEQTRQAGQKMQQLGRQMADGKMDKRQALAQSASLSKQLANAQQAAGSQAQQQAAAGQASSLSEQMAQQARQAARQSPAQAKQTAGQAQKLADRTPPSMPQTKQHAQAASDAQKRGDPSGATREWQKAADAAKREGAGQQKPALSQSSSQQDAQGVQNAQKQVDGARQEVAQAAGPQDVSDKPQGEKSQSQSEQSQSQGQSSQKPQFGQSGRQGQKSGAGQGTKPGGKAGQQGAQGQQQGQNGNNGKPAPSGSGKSTPSEQSGQQPGTEHGPGSPAQKKPHSLNPAFKPSANPGYGKIFLGQGTGKGSRTVQAKPGQAQAQNSTVPVSPFVPQFQKGAESAMDREDVPPAYKDNVRDYFNSLGGGK